MKTFEARYPGRCAAGDEISVGDILAYDSDRQGIHVECADYPDRPKKRGEICPRCFTEKSLTGACAC